MGHGVCVRIMLLDSTKDGGGGVLTIIVFVKYALIIKEPCVQSFKTLRAWDSAECKHLKRKTG